MLTCRRGVFLRVLGILVLPLLASCQLKPRFEVGYRVPEASREAVSSGTVHVFPLEDARPPTRREQQGKIFLLYIPLWPWVTVRYVGVDQIVVETSRKGGKAFSFASPTVQKIDDPEAVLYPNSFADAIAYDLDRSHVFTAATTGPSGSADYQLNGRLEHTEYRVTYTSYFAGMGGVLLWFLPVPMCKVVGEVSLDLVLTDSSTGDEVWRGTVDGEEWTLRTMYATSAMIHGTGLGAFTFQVQKGRNDDYVDPYSVFWWDFMALRDGMEKAKPAIEAAIRRYETSATR